MEKKKNVLMSEFRAANCYSLKKIGSRKCKGIGKFRLVLIDDR